MLVCVTVSSACMPPHERIPTNAEIEAVVERERAFRCGACVSLDPDIAERIAEGLPNPVESVFLTAVRRDGGVLVRERSWPFTGMHYYWLVGDLDGKPDIFWVPSEGSMSVNLNPTTFPPVLNPPNTKGIDLCHSSTCLGSIRYPIGPSQADGS